MTKCVVCGEFQAELCPSCVQILTPAQKAAPELLEALRSIRETLDMLGPGNSKAQSLGQVAYARGVAKAAIAKAVEADPMTETSALQAYIKQSRPTFDEAAYRAALQSDWDRGRPEEIPELDADGTGGVIRTSDGYESHIATMRFDGTPLSDFRSIRRSATTNLWREVFAKDVAGKVWYVGKLKLWTRMPGASRP